MEIGRIALVDYIDLPKVGVHINALYARCDRLEAEIAKLKVEIAELRADNQAIRSGF